MNLRAALPAVWSYPTAPIGRLTKRNRRAGVECFERIAAECHRLERRAPLR